MPPPEQLVALGAVGKPHGLRGELRVHRFNEGSPLLLEVGEIWLRKDGAARLVRVEAARPHGPLVLMTLEGVRGRDAAEALRGAEVCVARDTLPPPDEGEVYHTDLIGLDAVLASGTLVGAVTDVLVYPSAECLLVRMEDADLEIPLLEPYVVEVNLTKRVVIVAHIEDLEPVRSGR